MKPIEQTYWNKYLATLSCDRRPVNAVVIAQYAGTPEVTDELIALYFAGKKCAGSSLVEDFVTMGDPLPEVGNYWIVLNSKSEPACILKTERVVTHKFKDVPVEIAIAEGEGDLSLAYWRKVHAKIWTPHLNAWGVNDIMESTVITEFFSIAYRE